MQIEMFSHPKSCIPALAGDDVLLASPDTVFAILDGATDPSGARYRGRTGGQIAASAAALALVDLLRDEGPDVSIERLGSALSGAVAKAAAIVDAAHPPSTTLAAAIVKPDGFRLVVIGDSGIRVNGERLMQAEKLIDKISTGLRLSIYRILATRITDQNALELACRTAIGKGLDLAVVDALLSAAERASIVTSLQNEFGGAIAGAEEDFLVFLNQGIITQPRFANKPDHPLGFASIIGTPPEGFGILEDLLPFDEFRSLELFSDGYFGLPQGTHLVDWERKFVEIEALDPGKTSRYPSVKGSTSSAFSDDRSVICLNVGI